MIINRDTHLHAACFDEINHAMENMTDTDVLFNAHTSLACIPATGGVIYNMENVGTQVGRYTYPYGVDLWDFSARNCEEWRKLGKQVTHVPIGYHPSMERFTPRPWEDRDIDVILCGAMNERRHKVLEGLRTLEIKVVHNPDTYGVERDKLLARSKLCLNMLYYEDGVFPALRAAHCAANRVGMLTEQAPEMWDGIDRIEYKSLVEYAEILLSQKNGRWVQQEADEVYEAFKSMPMVLPREQHKSAFKEAFGFRPDQMKMDLTKVKRLV